MNIKEFIESNHTCPVCQKTLTLYLQVGTVALMRARPIHQNTFEVHTILDKNTNVANLFKEQVIELIDVNNVMKISIPEEHFDMEYLDEDFHLFYLCNADALNFTKHSEDYIIESGKACHFKSSHSFRISQPNYLNGLCNIYPNELTESIKDDLTLFKYESYAIREFKEEQEMTKVYIVKIDHHKKETHFHYYTFTKEQAKEKNFRPKILSKTFDVVRDKLDYSSGNRDKLLHKFDSWLLIS